jgi:hypothetical protein
VGAGCALAQGGRRWQRGLGALLLAREEDDGVDGSSWHEL